MTENNIPAVGSAFHVLSALSFRLTENQSVSATRGQTFTVTDELVAANLDRRGNSWLSLLDDPDAQVERWGEVKVAPGECPESITWWNGPGDDASRSLARSLAIDNIKTHVKDPSLAANKLAEVDTIYGRASTSRSISYLS